MGSPSSKMPKRVVIFAPDIVILTGLSIHSAYRKMREMRIAFGKGPGMFITIDEFCLYTGIAKELVLECINR